RGGQAVDRGDWNRGRAVLQGLRPESLFEIGDSGFFRQRDVWRRPAADGIQHHAVAGVFGEGAAFGSGAPRYRSRLHRKSRLHGRAVGRTKTAEAGFDQLCGLSGEILQRHTGCAEVFSDVSTRFVWRWNRRGIGAVLLRLTGRLRVVSIRGIPGARTSRIGEGRAVHISFSGWECVSGET